MTCCHETRAFAAAHSDVGSTANQFIILCSMVPVVVTGITDEIMAALRVRDSSARVSRPEPHQDETAVDIPIQTRRSHPGSQTASSNSAIGKAFAQGYMSDDHIANVVQRNFCCILFWASCVLFGCLFWAYRFRLSVMAKGRASVHPKTRFCSHNSHLCQYASYAKSILYDYRKTRDAQLDPSGTHTQFEPSDFKVDVCQLPILLHYADDRIPTWWGHVLEEQTQALDECRMPCRVVPNATDAHIMIGMFEAPEQVRRRERLQKAAVISLEGHSLSKQALSGADLLVSFHDKSDVVVNYFYSLKHGVPCTDPLSDCLDIVQKSLRATGNAVEQTGGRGGAKGRKAVAFISNMCDRHGGYLQQLFDQLARGIGVDSYGMCHNNAKESSHPLYVGGNAEQSKELISGSYKFNLVMENALIDDYVTEKFFEGLKAGSLMVYLGAPNIAKFAPAPRSFVNAHDFADAAELADYLRALDDNATHYTEYFTWRSDPSGPSAVFRGLAERDFALSGAASWQCRLCSAFVDRFCPK